MFFGGNKTLVLPKLPLARDGLLDLTIRTPGISPELWPERLKGQGFAFNNWAENLFYTGRSSGGLRPCEPKDYCLRIFFGRDFNSGQCTELYLAIRADSCHCSIPPWEVALVLYEKLAKWDVSQLRITRIIIMHVPTPTTETLPSRFMIDGLNGPVAERELGAIFAPQQHGWRENTAFAYLA